MEQKDISKIDAALIILLLTVLAYGGAYLFELGYQKYYHLPNSLIDLNVTAITKSVTFTLLVIGAFFLFGNTFGNISVGLSPLYVGKIPKWVIVFFIILFLIASIILGWMYAKKKEEYLVVTDKENKFAVVTIYKDNFVLSPLDIHTKAIKPEFRIVEMKSIESLETISFTNGLKVKEVREGESIWE